MELTAKAFKYGDDINTDYIISGKYKFKSNDMEVMAHHAMEELDPNYYDKVKPEGGFLVAGKNFGMGPSREQAPLVLNPRNTKAVRPKSFAAIISRNAIKPRVKRPSKATFMASGLPSMRLATGATSSAGYRWASPSKLSHTFEKSYAANRHPLCHQNVAVSKENRVVRVNELARNEIAPRMST